MKTKNKTIFLKVTAIISMVLTIAFLMPTRSALALTIQKPRVHTGSATSITETSVLLSGSADPNNTATVAWFEWGSSVNGLTSETSRQNMGTGDSSLTYILALDGLSAGTTYFYRAVAENNLGKIFGSTRTFKTKPLSTSVSTNNKTITNSNSCSAPIARTLSAISITNISASLKASVHPKGHTTQIWFEYGTTNSLGQTVGSQILNSFLTETTITQTLAGLNPGTKYFYKVFAQSECGRVSGAISNFTTSGTPPAPTTPSSTKNTGATAAVAQNDTALAFRTIPTQSQPQPVPEKIIKEGDVLGTSISDGSFNSDTLAVKNPQKNEVEKTAAIGFFASGSNIFFTIILALILFSIFSVYQNHRQFYRLVKNNI